MSLESLELNKILPVRHNRKLGQIKNQYNIGHIKSPLFMHKYHLIDSLYRYRLLTLNARKIE